MLASSAALLLAPPASAQPRGRSFSDFLARARELADLLPAVDRRSQDAYLHALVARALPVEAFPTPQMFPMDPFAGVEIGPLAQAQFFVIIAYRLAPGAVLPAHNHPNYSVATLGLEGEARVRHYEVDGAPPSFDSDETFAVRETARRLLRAGEATTLTPSRDNIHTFEAGPHGARFVDLTTLHGQDAGFSYLDIEAAGGDRYRARRRAA